MMFVGSQVKNDGLVQLPPTILTGACLMWSAAIEHIDP
jgi:hypothetical protein